MCVCVCVCVCSGAQSCPTLLQPQGLQPAMLLWPWDSPGQNTGVGCHVLFQGIFLTQGSNPRLLCLLHWQVDSLLPGKPQPRCLKEKQLEISFGTWQGMLLRVQWLSGLSWGLSLMHMTSHPPNSVVLWKVWSPLNLIVPRARELDKPHLLTQLQGF